MTLEPCSHNGKSPPCADAIIKAGIARVVSAHRGSQSRSRRAGPRPPARQAALRVDVGLFADEARRAHAGHITRVLDHRGRM